MASMADLKAMSSMLIEDWGNLPAVQVIEKLELHRKTKVFFPLVCDIYNPIVDNIFMNEAEEEEYHQKFADKANEMFLYGQKPIESIALKAGLRIWIYLENEKYYFGNGGDRFLKTQTTLAGL